MIDTTMRALALLLCLGLAACGAGTRLMGDAGPSARSVPAPVEADDPPSAAPAAATTSAPATPPSGPRDVTEAKVICWGKVEREKQRVRSIDQRIAYVERCVAEQMKGN